MKADETAQPSADFKLPSIGSRFKRKGDERDEDSELPTMKQSGNPVLDELQVSSVPKSIKAPRSIAVIGQKRRSVPITGKEGAFKMPTLRRMAYQSPPRPGTGYTSPPRPYKKTRGN